MLSMQNVREKISDVFYTLAKSYTQPMVVCLPLILLFLCVFKHFFP